MSYVTKFFGDYYQYMENALDGLQTQQRAIADNIANADNPNYHAVHVNFQNQLQDILKKGDDDDDDMQVHLEGFDPEFNVQDPNNFKPQISTDPNSHVDLNYEMAQLAKTQMLYNFATGAVKPGFTKFVIETMISH